jgi:hypothetical protein
LNDFFANRDVALSAVGERLLLYVGSTGRYRQLESMVTVASSRSARCVIFCVQPEDVARQLGAVECHELDNYQDTLLRCTEGNAAYMWCSFDETVLSYRFSLPNKFFQAVALGVPIIAAPRTYLGRLVRRHGFGMTVEAEDSGAMDPWDPAVYAAKSAAMRRFRSEFRQGKVVL